MSEQPTKKTCTLQQENWAFKSDCKEKFFQFHVDNKVYCLFCPVIISMVKSFNVKRLYKIHSARYDCNKEESRKKKLELLKSAPNKQTNMFKCGNEC